MRSGSSWSACFSSVITVPNFIATNTKSLQIDLVHGRNLSNTVLESWICMLVYAQKHPKTSSTDFSKSTLRPLRARGPSFSILSKSLQEFVTWTCHCTKKRPIFNNAQNYRIEVWKHFPCLDYLANHLENFALHMFAFFYSMPWWHLHTKRQRFW